MSWLAREQDKFGDQQIVPCVLCKNVDCIAQLVILWDSQDSSAKFDYVHEYTPETNTFVSLAKLTYFRRTTCINIPMHTNEFERGVFSCLICDQLRAMLLAGVALSFHDFDESEAEMHLATFIHWPSCSLQGQQVVEGVGWEIHTSCI